MYFGGADDGSMKTGRQTIDLDGESFSFKFETKSNIKGAGITGEDDDKYYVGGKLIKADKEDKYQIVEIGSFKNTDNLDVNVVIDDGVKVGDIISNVSGGRVKDSTVWDLKNVDLSNYRVINTSGKIVDGNKSVKNGDDYKIKVNKEGIIESITLED